jgi:two-component system OmpR family sensor kinase
MAADAVADARVVEPDRPIELDVDGPVQVIGDGARLRQVFDNLLTNIRTHTPPGTPASVRVRRNGETAVLVVDDEGPGMSDEEAARAFERFYRVDPSRARTSGGVGLGLSIVNAIVAAHDGTVTLESKPGEGATFTITLPVDGPAAPSAAEDDQELDEPVVLGADGAEARVGDVVVGEGHGDRSADADSVS